MEKGDHMRTLVAAVLIFGVTVAYALDTPAASSGTRTAPEATVAPVASPVAVSSETKSAVPAPAPVAVSTQTKSETPAPVSKIEEPKKAEIEPVVLAGCVAPLQSMVTFHEKEIVSLKQMIDRWDAKVKESIKRRQGLEKEVKSRLQEADALLQQNTRTAKREANRLKKEAGRINKDIASINKEIKSQSRELAAEVRDVTKETQQALEDAYHQAVVDIQKSQD